MRMKGNTTRIALLFVGVCATVCAACGSSDEPKADSKGAEAGNGEEQVIDTAVADIAMNDTVMADWTAGELLNADFLLYIPWQKRLS